MTLEERADIARWDDDGGFAAYSALTEAARRRAVATLELSQEAYVVYLRATSTWEFLADR